jgi:hypothetical protein
MSLVTYHAINIEMTDKTKTIASKITIAFWANGTKKSMKHIGKAIKNSRLLL